jgi:hypothetical protein
MLTSWARRSEDLTFDKTDEKDAVIIARLTSQLRCYVPEPVDETWGRLRHLGARREQLLVEAGSQVQQMRALLECVWPAALQTARQPFRSSTWTAAMSIVVDRDGGDLTRTRRLGLARFETAVRREVIRRGRQKPCLRIVRLLFAALIDPAGVIAHRAGALERVALLPRDVLRPLSGYDRTFRRHAHRASGTRPRPNDLSSPSRMRSSPNRNSSPKS